MARESVGRYERWLARRLPETAAGGYSRFDGTVEFYTRVRALTGPESTVADFGAGRGAFLDDPVPFRRDLRRLRGRVHRVIGLDVDPVVRTNPGLDEAHVIVAGEPLPLPDASVDLVLADFVFEHVRDPAWASREIGRILRPGGWICARTPNRFGVIAAGARLVPNRFHVAVLRVLQPTKRKIDTFPTVYRMNTRRDLLDGFPPAGFEHCTYTRGTAGTYVGRSRVGWVAARILVLLTPAPLRPMLFVLVRKR